MGCCWLRARRSIIHIYVCVCCFGLIRAAQQTLYEYMLPYTTHTHSTQPTSRGHHVALALCWYIKIDFRATVGFSLCVLVDWWMFVFDVCACVWSAGAMLLLVENVQFICYMLLMWLGELSATLRVRSDCKRAPFRNKKLAKICL